MTVEKRALNGTIVSTFSFLVGLGQTIVIVPILISFWGVDNYGLWIGLSALTSLLQTIDNGHQNYIGNELTKFYVSDTHKLKVTLASSIWMAGLLGLAQILISLGIVIFGITEKLIGYDSPFKEDQEVGLSLIILTITWLITGSIGGILSRLYLPAGLFVRFTLWGIFTRLFNITSILLTATFGGGILLASVIGSVVTFSIYILFFLDFYKIFYRFYPFWVGGNFKTAFTNVSKSFLLTGAGFLNQLQNNGLTLFVSSIAGVSSIALLSTMRTLANTFLAATNIVTVPLAPEMTRYHIQGEHKKLVDMISTARWSGGLLINMGLVITLPFIEIVYLHWTRGQISFSWSLYLMLAWSISLKNFGNPQIIYLMGINHIKFQTTIAVVQTTVVLAITSLFLAKYGLIAVGIAIVCSEVIGSVILSTIYTITEVKSLGGSFNFSNVILAFFPIVVVGLIYLSVGFYWISPLVGSIVGAIILIGLYCWQWQYLSIDVRHRLVNLIYKFIPLGRK